MYTDVIKLSAYRRLSILARKIKGKSNSFTFHNNFNIVDCAYQLGLA